MEQRDVPQENVKKKLQAYSPWSETLQQRDVLQALALLDAYLQRYAISPEFSEDELSHALLPTDDVISSFVVEGSDGRLTDFVSFYTLPSSIIGNDKHDELRAAFQYYTVPGATPLAQLMSDALILAKRSGHDVFNALDLLENETFLKDLKFGVGDGKLRYYLYNWRVARELQPSEVGLLLL